MESIIYQLTLLLIIMQLYWNNTVNRAATEPTRFEDRPRLMSKIRKISDDNNMWTKWLKSSSLTTDGIYLPLIDYTTPYSTVNIAGTIRHVFSNSSTT